MKVEIETEDRLECTPCEYKDTKKKKKINIHTLRSYKSKSEERKFQKFQGDECEYNSSEKEAQEPYRRD